MAEEEFTAYEEVAGRTETADLEESERTHEGAQTTYSGIRTYGFKDMLLRPELLKAISDAAFEHPSEVQHECLQPAILGEDILCQAKAGMGKTAVFVLSTLQVITEPEDDTPRVLVICHTREMALQLLQEYERFAKYYDFLKGRIVKVHGGVGRQQDVAMIQKAKPIIVIGTPGRLFDLASPERGPAELDLSKIEHFIVDECDRLLSDATSAKQIVALFSKCPKAKQTMLFSATMPEETRAIAKRFLRKDRTHEKFIDADTKLTLHGLDQFYIKTEEKDKVDLLFKILDENRGYNQVIIFVNKNERAEKLGELLVKNSFPAYTICGSYPVDRRLAVYNAFKENKQRFLVATELFARGVDVQAVNLVINFDAPADRHEAPQQGKRGAPSPPAAAAAGVKTVDGSDQYLHRIGRAGRFGTRGSAVTFLASADDVAMMNKIRTRFGVTLKEITRDKLADLTKDLASSAEAS